MNKKTIIKKTKKGTYDTRERERKTQFRKTFDKLWREMVPLLHRRLVKITMSLAMEKRDQKRDAFIGAN